MSTFETLARELEADPARRQALRALLLSEELLSLPATTAAMVTTLEALTARVDQLTARVDQLTVALEALTARVDQLTARVDQLAGRVDELTEVMRGVLVRLDRLETDVGDLKGSDLERKWQRDLPSYLGGRFRRLRVLGPGRLRDLLDDAADAGRITHQEAHDAALADVVAKGRRSDDGAEVYVVAEVSVVVDGNDVDRAARRAAVVSRAADAPAVAVAAGRRSDAGASADEAARQHVLVVLDGLAAA